MKHIRVRISFYFSSIIVITILATAGSISWVYNKKLIEQTGTIADQKMQIITMDIDKEIATVLGICDNLRDNDELQELMNQPDKGFQNDYSQMKKISDILQKGIYAYTSVTSIFATNLNKQIYDPLYQMYPYREFIADYKDFNEFITSGKFNAFSAPTNFPNRLDGIDDRGKSEITFFSQYMSNYNFKQFGYLLININKEQLFREVSQTHKKVFDFTYVIDEKNEVIYKFGNPLQEDNIILAFGAQGDKNHKILKIGGEEYYLISQPLSAYPDWKVVGGIGYGKVKKDSALILKIVYIIGILSIFIGVLIAYILAKKITDPILEINRAMTQFEDRKWPDQLKAKTEDELKSLIHGFNHMVDQFKTLLDQVHKEHEEKIKVEVNSLELKLELLQAQINPHFIHNTLNAVKYLALLKGAEDIKEIIHSFNLLLRASISEARDFISIKEELQLVDSYIRIQRYRYDNDFQVLYVLDDCLEKVQVPKLILQPIVENSLFHGIIPKGCQGTIRISIFAVHEKILISVIDDGIGIETDKLESILTDNLPQNSKKGFNNIGLNNINTRLKLYYGDAYTLQIESSFGEGTCVWFYIPK